MPLKIKLLMLLMMMNIVSCKGNVTGEVLIFIDGGQDIFIRELERGEAIVPDILYSSPESTLINSVTKYRDSKILIGECSVMGACLIKEIDILVGEGKVLFEGAYPVYNKINDSVYFYKLDEEAKDWALMVYDFKESSATRLAIMSGMFSYENIVLNNIYHPVVIGNKKVFFYLNNNLQSIDIQSRELLTYDIGFKPVTYDSKESELVMFDHVGMSYNKMNGLGSDTLEPFEKLKDASGVMFDSEEYYFSLRDVRNRNEKYSVYRAGSGINNIVKVLDGYKFVSGAVVDLK